MAIEFLKPFGIQIINTHKNPVSFDAIISADRLKKLIKKYSVVILRDFLPVDKASLVNYAKTIGSLLEWDFGAVMEMRVHEEPKNYLFTHENVPFHWDGAFHQEPRYLLFHCIEAPSENSGGETLFSNTQLIWQKASILEKKIWKNLNISYTTEKIAHYGGSITVPLVQIRPDTKKTILRFSEPVSPDRLNPVSVKIEDYDEKKASALIEALIRYCYDTKNCYIHTWKKNDFLISDNHALLHGRFAFKEFTPRHLRRIQVL